MSSEAEIWKTNVINKTREVQKANKLNSPTQIIGDKTTKAAQQSPQKTLNTGTSESTSIELGVFPSKYYTTSLKSSALSSQIKQFSKAVSFRKERNQTANSKKVAGRWIKQAKRHSRHSRQRSSKLLRPSKLYFEPVIPQSLTQSYTNQSSKEKTSIISAGQFSYTLELSSFQKRQMKIHKLIREGKYRKSHILRMREKLQQLRMTDSIIESPQVAQHQGSHVRKAKSMHKLLKSSLGFFHTQDLGNNPEHLTNLKEPRFTSARYRLPRLDGVDLNSMERIQGVNSFASWMFTNRVNKEGAKAVKGAKVLDYEADFESINKNLKLISNQIQESIKEEINEDVKLHDIIDKEKAQNIKRRYLEDLVERTFENDLGPSHASQASIDRIDEGSQGGAGSDRNKANSSSGNLSQFNPDQKSHKVKGGQSEGFKRSTSLRNSGSIRFKNSSGGSSQNWSMSRSKSRAVSPNRSMMSSSRAQSPSKSSKPRRIKINKNQLEGESLDEYLQRLHHLMNKKHRIRNKVFDDERKVGNEKLNSKNKTDNVHGYLRTKRTGTAVRQKSPAKLEGAPPKKKWKRPVLIKTAVLNRSESMGLGATKKPWKLPSDAQKSTLTRSASLNQRKVTPSTKPKLSGFIAATPNSSIIPSAFSKQKPPKRLPALNSKILTQLKNRGKKNPLRKTTFPLASVYKRRDLVRKVKAIMFYAATKNKSSIPPSFYKANDLHSSYFTDFREHQSAPESLVTHQCGTAFSSINYKITPDKYLKLASFLKKNSKKMRSLIFELSFSNKEESFWEMVKGRRFEQLNKYILRSTTFFENALEFLEKQIEGAPDIKKEFFGGESEDDLLQTGSRKNEFFEKLKKKLNKKQLESTQELNSLENTLSSLAREDTEPAPIDISFVPQIIGRSQTMKVDKTKPKRQRTGAVRVTTEAKKPSQPPPAKLESIKFAFIRTGTLEVTDRLMEFLSSKKLRIKSLSLENCIFYDKGMDRIIKVVPELTHLENLSLADYSFTERDAKLFSNLWLNQRLRYLNLDRILFSSLGGVVKTIQELIRGDTLKFLSMRGCDLRLDPICSLVDTFLYERGSSMKSLNLSKNLFDIKELYKKRYTEKIWWVETLYGFCDEMEYLQGGWDECIYVTHYLRNVKLTNFNDELDVRLIEPKPINLVFYREDDDAMINPEGVSLYHQCPDLHRWKKTTFTHKSKDKSECFFVVTSFYKSYHFFMNYDSKNSQFSLQLRLPAGNHSYKIIRLSRIVLGSELGFHFEPKREGVVFVDPESNDQLLGLTAAQKSEAKKQEEKEEKTIREDIQKLLKDNKIVRIKDKTIRFFEDKLTVLTNSYILKQILGAFSRDPLKRLDFTKIEFKLVKSYMTVKLYSFISFAEQFIKTYDPDLTRSSSAALKKFLILIKILKTEKDEKFFKKIAPKSDNLTKIEILQTLIKLAMLYCKPYEDKIIAIRKFFEEVVYPSGGFYYKELKMKRALMSNKFLEQRCWENTNKLKMIYLALANEKYLKVEVLLKFLRGKIWRSYEEINFDIIRLMAVLSVEGRKHMGNWFSEDYMNEMNFDELALFLLRLAVLKVPICSLEINLGLDRDYLLPIRVREEDVDEDAILGRYVREIGGYFEELVDLAYKDTYERLIARGLKPLFSSVCVRYNPDDELQNGIEEMMD